MTASDNAALQSLRSLSAVLTEAVIAVDRNAVISFANAPAGRLLGTTPDGLEGRELSRWLPGVSRESIHPADGRPTVFTISTPVRSATGTFVTSVPITAVADGELFFIVIPTTPVIPAEPRRGTPVERAVHKANNALTIVANATALLADTIRSAGTMDPRALEEAEEDLALVLSSAQQAAAAIDSLLALDGGPPARTEPAEPTAPAASPTSASSHELRRPGEKRAALVVDDDAVVRSILARLLATAGYHTVVAESAAAALGMLEDGRIDIHIVIADVHMPEMPGTDLVVRALSLRPGIAAVLMSGAAVPTSPELRDVVAIRKPFTAASMLHALAEATARAA